MVPYSFPSTLITPANSTQSTISANRFSWQKNPADDASDNYWGAKYQTKRMLNEKSVAIKAKPLSNQSFITIQIARKSLQLNEELVSLNSIQQHIISIKQSKLNKEKYKNKIREAQGFIAIA